MPNQIQGNRWLIALALWVPVAFTLVLFFLAILSQHTRDVDARWVLHTVEVKEQVEHLDSLVKDVGAAERGFLLTGDGSFLPLYEDALGAIPAESDRLARLIEDNPTQVTNTARLRGLIAEKLSVAAKALSRVQQDKIPETLEMYRDTQGKALTDEIRAQVEAMKAEEDRLLSLRENDFALQVKSQKNEMIGLVAVEIGLIIGLTLLLLRSRSLELTADTRIGEALAMTDQAQAGTLNAMARTEQAEVRAEAANTRTEEAEIREEEAIHASEIRYRRLFETAQDGIIVLDSDTGGVVDANPFMQDLLGYSQEEMLGRKLWEIAPFKGAAASKIAFSNLVKSGRIQKENLSLETKDGRQIEVEFISSAYRMNDNLLVQCNIRNITERKKAEQDLILLHTCIAHLNDIVLVTEAASTNEPGPRIVFVNEAFERMTGYTSAEALGRSPRFLQGPKTDRRVLDEIHQAVAQRKPIRRQIINYHKDGSEFWLDMDIVPIFNARGNCTHFAGIERDVSMDKNKEESLNLFRALMEQSPDAIEVIDPDTGRFLDINETACERLGYSREEMLSFNFLDIALPKTGESPVSMEVLRGEARKAGLRVIECRNRRKDGSSFPVEVSIKYIQLNRDYFVAVVRDITERKQAEEVRRKTEERYRKLFDYAPDGILIVGPNNVYVDANVSICRMLGYTREELIGLAAAEIVAESDLERVDPALSVIRSKTDHHREWKFRRKDGSVFEVDAISTLTPDGNVLAMIRDITDRKKNEARFRRLVDSNAQGVIFWNRNGTITGGNDAFLRMVGHTREDLDAGRVNWKTLTPLEYSDFDHRALDEMGAKGSCDPYEKEYVRKNGARVPVLIGSAIFEDNADEGVSFVVDISKRKGTEQKLYASESRYSALFANMLGGYAYCRILFDQGHAVDLIYLEVNKSFEALTGLKNVVGKKLSEVVPGVGETNPELIEIYGRVALTGKSEKFETHLKPLGIWLSISVYSNEAAHITVVFENISERKRNEGRFRRLVDSNAQSVMFWNTKGEITGANDAFLHLLRYTRADLEAGVLQWMKLTPPEYATIDRSSFAIISEKGACAPYRKQFIRKDGQRVSVLIGGAIFEDNPEEGVAFMLDLTESECAAEQIAEQAALLDEAQDAIIVRDLEGKAVFWNKGAERMYGWTRQEVLGMNVSKMLFRQQKRYAEVNALTIDQGKWSGDLQHLTKDKKEITVEARWTLIRDEKGEPKSVLAINTDVTEKKKIEGQFLRAQRMDSIGTLASGVAHDLNNILTPILMAIELLKETATDPEALRFLRTIEVSAQRGADIVKQVLSFARGVEGERVEIQPKSLLKDLESIIKNTFPKNIRLQFCIPDDTWMILGDPTQVHQILLNLCVNARDAMPNGGDLAMGMENCELDEQYAAMHLHAKAGRYVTINVSDSGTGIPQDILDKIFEPFFTTKEINEGTGLGLSTVMGIVKSHGGAINVYSETGKGTSFKVYLPAMELSSAAQMQLTQQIIVPRGNGEMVLVIDDEASILTITSETLTAFGYRVLTAIDGAEAVAVFAENRDEIAVVLTDMSMPIMDGAALIRALTKINPDIKIIAASGLNANGEVAKVAGLTVKHFLTKPYTARTLLKVIRTTLDL